MHLALLFLKRRTLRLQKRNKPSHFLENFLYIDFIYRLCIDFLYLDYIHTLSSQYRNQYPVSLAGQAASCPEKPALEYNQFLFLAWDNVLDFLQLGFSIWKMWIRQALRSWIALTYRKRCMSCLSSTLKLTCPCMRITVKCYKMMWLGQSSIYILFLNGDSFQCIAASLKHPDVFHFLFFELKEV